MQYLFIPIEAVFYLKICALALIVVAVCRLIEFVQGMRIKAVEMDTARVENETAKHQQNLVLEAIRERQNRKL